MSRLAPMPPTCAARWITRSGRASAQQAPHGGAVDQIVFGASAGTNGPRASRAQPLDDERAQEAGAAGDDDASPLPKGAH